MLLEKITKRFTKIKLSSTKLDAEALEQIFWKSWKKSGKEDIPEIGDVIRWTLDNINDSTPSWKWRKISEKEPLHGQEVVICDSTGYKEVNVYFSDGRYEDGSTPKFWLPLPENDLLSKN